MPDVSTKQPVECPICGDEFDPTVAGGWCTNTECGEWQYTESETTGSSDSASVKPDEDGFVSPVQEDDTDTESDDLFEGSDDAGVEAADVVTEDDTGVKADEMADDDTGVEVEDEVADDDTGVEADEMAGGDAAADDTDETVAGDATEDEQADAGTDDAVDDSDAAEATDGVVAEAVEGDEPASEAADAAAEAEAEAPGDASAAVDDTVDDDEADDPRATDADDAEAAAVEADAAEAAAVDTDDSADAAHADSIDCPDCGVELDADANFCVECGADVSTAQSGEVAELDTCPGCGTDVEPGDNFCVSCGEDLEAHRGGGADHDDAVDALEASADESGEPKAPESLVLDVEGREIRVDDGDTVGREVRAALTAAGRPDDEAVRIHREHVRFIREHDSFYVLDLGDNPTALNGQSLQKGDREPVAPGDELELSGVASMTVQAP